MVEGKKGGEEDLGGNRDFFRTTDDAVRRLRDRIRQTSPRIEFPPADIPLPTPLPTARTMPSVKTQLLTPPPVAVPPAAS